MTVLGLGFLIVVTVLSLEPIVLRAMSHRERLRAIKAAKDGDVPPELAEAWREVQALTDHDESTDGD